MRNIANLYLLTLATVLSVGFAAPAAKADSTPPAVKDWTFLVYMNGNNNLDSYGTLNLTQMEKVGSTDQFNVVVQWASIANGKTERLLIQKSSDSSAVTSPVVQDMGQVDMGDWHSLSDFLQWGVAHYPAKHYFVDVWDHGSGWHNLQIRNMTSGNTLSAGANASMHANDISWDENTGHFITTAELAEALQEGAKAMGHKIDAYGSDACLMAMAEVADQVSDSVEFYLGSEETEPVEGWPYDQLLTHWAAIPHATGADLGRILSNDYVKSYEGGENGTKEVTFSAFDLSKLGALTDSIKGLGKSFQTMDATTRKKILAAASSTQEFAIADYGDLLDFLTQIESKDQTMTGNPELSSVRKAVTDFVIAADATPHYAKAKGLSIWLPTDLNTYQTYADKYSAMVFEQQTQWGESLKYLLQDSNK